MLSKVDSNPILSVILPAYNVELYIRECIDSILNQTFVDFELIIADDGSTDNTQRIIDSYKDKRIVISHNTENSGKTKTVNRLFLLTKGKYITVHDADDWSNESRFEKQLAWLENSSKRIMCGTGYLSFDTDREVIENFIPFTNYDELKESIKVNGQFHGPTMIFRKSSLDSNCIYREYFNDNYEDTDLAYRLFQKGICTNIDEPLYNYRILETSLCRKEFTIRNKNLYHVVVYLAKQRELTGIDDLMCNQNELVDAYFDEITVEYKTDKGLVFREGAAYYMYWNYYSKAIKYSIKAIKHDPLKLINWRTFLYCVRKGIYL